MSQIVTESLMVERVTFTKHRLFARVNCCCEVGADRLEPRLRPGFLSGGGWVGSRRCEASRREGRPASTQ